MMKIRYWSIGLAAALSMGLSACGNGSEGETPANNAANSATANNNDGKGDTPTGEETELCAARGADLVNANRPAFLEDFVRWSCADVEGVNTSGRDDRGQEYCEYFAVIQTPDELGEGWTETGLTLGRPHVGSGEELQRCGTNGDCDANSVCIGVHRNADPACASGRCSLCAPVTTDFNDDQQFFLEDQGAEVVGKCIFTSWHSDVPGPLPCGENCTDVYNHPLDVDNLRMLNSINSNNAASDLVQKCVSGVAESRYRVGDAEDEADPFHDPFFRACMWNADLFGTHWRFSDPSVCTAGVRAAECGCTVGGDPSIDLGFALVPPVHQQMEEGGISLRGFPLGTWGDSSGLPNGCRYVDIGNEFNGNPSQTIVECDIRGLELLDNLQDPKDFCRKKYGSDVVVHVPIPKDAIQCDPPADGQYSDTCSATPWVVTAADGIGRANDNVTQEGDVSQDGGE
jgi:hypothetical protein